jgi:hypothetical protein
MLIIRSGVEGGVEGVVGMVNEIRFRRIALSSMPENAVFGFGCWKQEGERKEGTSLPVWSLSIGESSHTNSPRQKARDGEWVCMWYGNDILAV